jgi:Steryl acetyl hydrolase
VPPLKLSAPLKGALLISPWISFDTSMASYKKNKESDYLTIPAVTRASKAFIGPGAQFDDFSEPVRAPPATWKGVAEVVDEIIVWGGGGEILIDSIRIFAKNIIDGFRMADSGSERVIFVETPRASHEQQIMDLTLRIKEKCEGTLVVEEWINARL